MLGGLLMLGGGRFFLGARHSHSHSVSATGARLWTFVALRFAVIGVPSGRRAGDSGLGERVGITRPLTWVAFALRGMPSNPRSLSIDTLMTRAVGYGSGEEASR